MITHSALDIIDERKLKPQPQTTGFDPYLGQLYMIDDYKVYGTISLVLSHLTLPYSTFIQVVVVTRIPK